MDNHHGEKWENTQIRQVGKLVGCISQGLLSISVTRILDFNKSVAKNNWKIRSILYSFLDCISVESSTGQDSWKF